MFVDPKKPTVAELCAEIEQLQAEVERLKKAWLTLYGIERMRFAALQRLTGRC